MDIEKIIQELNGRFALPLPEYYHRRIIFWHDEEREFEDKLDEIQLDNAKIVVLTGSNTFVVKKLLQIIWFIIRCFLIDRTMTGYLI